MIVFFIGCYVCGGLCEVIQWQCALALNNM